MSKIKKSRLTINPQRKTQLLLVAACVILGAITLALSRASTIATNLEAENGTKCNSAMEKQSSSASNSRYVRFSLNACAQGGEDVRGVQGELGLFPTNPTSLLDQWLWDWSLPDQGHDEGAFRFQCKPSHLKYDDPIVKPGQPGAMHLHLFYGNETADANSTYESLRKNGTGTCEGGPINRSAYWIPALLNESGSKVILPDFVQIYYKVQQPRISQLNYIPRGLRYIAGNPLDSGATEEQVYGPRNTGVPGGFYRHPIWKCYANDGSGAQRNESDTIPQCQDGDALYSAVPFPFCWHKDQLLDSNDHRTHVVFPPDYDDNCPTSHPHRIPEFTILTKWSIRTGDSAKMKDWYLSSDRGHSSTIYPNGKSMHADWFGAWDDTIMKRWIDNCLKGYKSCNNANMGDGKAGKRPIVPWYEQHPNRLVDTPPHP